MKLEVGMYVRTKDGEIHKCVIIHKDNINSTLDRFMNEWGNMIMFDEILKASDNIIDLIEVGDYVNGEKVTSIESNGWLGFGNHDLYLSNEEEIETIVTKELFFNAEYRVETD